MTAAPDKRCPARAGLRFVGTCIRGRPLWCRGPDTLQGWDVTDVFRPAPDLPEPTQDASSFRRPPPRPRSPLSSESLRRASRWGARNVEQPTGKPRPGMRSAQLRCRGAADAGGLAISLARRVGARAERAAGTRYWKQLQTPDEQEREWLVHEHVQRECCDLTAVHACLGRHNRYWPRDGVASGQHAYQFVPFLDFEPHEMTLGDAMSGPLKPSMQRLRWWLHCTARQLAALHSCGVAHNALTPEAVLLVKQPDAGLCRSLGDAYDELQPKIGEFCMAVVFDRVASLPVTVQPRMPVESSLGTPPAPVPDSIQRWGHAPEIEIGADDDDEPEVALLQSPQSPTGGSPFLRRVLKRREMAQRQPESPLRSSDSQRDQGSPRAAGSPRATGSPKAQKRKKRKRMVARSGPGPRSDVYLFGLLLRWVLNMGAHRGPFGDTAALVTAERRRRREQQARAEPAAAAAAPAGRVGQKGGFYTTAPQPGEAPIDALLLLPELERPSVDHRYGGVSVVEAEQLVCDALARDPHQRISSRHVQYHPFFWSVGERVSFLSALLALLTARDDATRAGAASRRQLHDGAKWRVPPSPCSSVCSDVVASTIRSGTAGVDMPELEPTLEPTLSDDALSYFNGACDWAPLAPDWLDNLKRADSSRLHVYYVSSLKGFLQFLFDIDNALRAASLPDLTVCDRSSDDFRAAFSLSRFPGLVCAAAARLRRQRCDSEAFHAVAERHQCSAPVLRYFDVSLELPPPAAQPSPTAAARPRPPTVRTLAALSSNLSVSAAERE
eukprot:TRINITY_DN11036_c0_g1_i2.p1 TRINITY_DN11036_c0_g1~~TRINITY_DN11036_c0_g1_i2.p1  ORF type:complete len:915 (+),score=203.68 TRINITY_DN11036_c0_g1_i2:401-2746(+)